MTCKHKFQVQVIIPSCPPVQILSCKNCNKQFYGYGGAEGKPEYISEVHTVKDPLWFTKIKEGDKFARQNF